MGDFWHRQNIHRCTLPVEEDIIENYIPGNGIYKRIKRKLQCFVMVWSNHPSLKIYCQSMKALQLEKINHLENNRLIIHPLSYFRTLWELIMIFISTMILFYLPLHMALGLLPNAWKHSKNIYITILFDVFCILDVILNFRTAYYDKHRELCFESKAIAKHYLRSNFFFDVLSSFPCTFSMYLDDSEDTFILFLIVNVLKFLRLYSCLYYLKNIAMFVNIDHLCQNLILITFIVLVLFQWIGCISIVISILSIGLYSSPAPLVNNSWLVSQNLWNQSAAQIYWKGLHRAVLLVSNSEIEQNEKTGSDTIFLVFVMFLSKIILTFILCHVVQMFHTNTSSNSKYKEMVLQVQQYMNYKQLSVATQRRLNKYFDFRYQKSYFKESEIINTISAQLQQEILLLKCHKLVENVGFFRGIPQSLLIRIVKSLKMEIYLENDIIIKENTFGNSMYFVASGTIALYTISGKELYHLEDGSHFGEISLVMPDRRRILTAVAIESCELYRLERKDFLRAVQIYPELLENIELVTAERYQNTIALDEKYKLYLQERKQPKK